MKRQELLATMGISRGSGMIFKCKLNLATKLQFVSSEAIPHATTQKPRRNSGGINPLAPEL